MPGLKHKLFYSMSLPVYDALGFQEILEKGGHSKPWVILINIKGSLKPYVVKLYKTIDIEARNKMTAEILGNILAVNFGLKTPIPAIINFTPQFCMQLNAQCEEIITDIDSRVKFGCEYITGSTIFRTTTKSHVVKKFINIPSLYAYDYFICNRDRNSNKPNLLIKNKMAFLIDHEMALEIDKDTKDRFINKQWDTRYQHHLFYERLKRKNDKNGMFDEFLLYLRELKLNNLDPYFKQLEDFGFNTDKELIKDYWSTIREKSSIFTDILYSSIQ